MAYELNKLQKVDLEIPRPVVEIYERHSFSYNGAQACRRALPGRGVR